MIPPDKVAILLPTLERDSNLRRALDSICQTAPLAQIVVAVDPHDRIARARAAKYPDVIIATCAESYQGCAYGWNTALAAAPPDMLVFVMGADDVIFLPGWLDVALVTLDEMHDSGVVGFDDGVARSGTADYFWSTHFLATRDFLIEHNGGVFAPPMYRGDYVDVELCDKAIKAGKFRKSLHAHIHHKWEGGVHGDATYQRASEYRVECRETWKARRDAGSPVTWEPILTD
jgi:glycosyltransferase involved in cell wall biosynthesis